MHSINFIPISIYGFLLLLRRSQDSRNERKAVREAGVEVKVEKTPPPQEEPEEVFDIEDYKDMTGKGSFDNGDPLTTNLYVGNINPKVFFF